METPLPKAPPHVQVLFIETVASCSAKLPETWDELQGWDITQLNTLVDLLRKEYHDQREYIEGLEKRDDLVQTAVDPDNEDWWEWVPLSLVAPTSATEPREQRADMEWLERYFEEKRRLSEVKYRLDVAHAMRAERMMGKPTPPWKELTHREQSRLGYAGTYEDLEVVLTIIGDHPELSSYAELQRLFEDATGRDGRVMKETLQDALKRNGYAIRSRNFASFVEAVKKAGEEFLGDEPEDD